MKIIPFLPASAFPDAATLLRRVRPGLGGTISKRRSKPSIFAIILLLIATLGAQPAAATTYLSVEPIPSGDVVGQSALARILSAGYPNLERWGNRLLNDCDVVQNVIAVLTA